MNKLMKNLIAFGVFVLAVGVCYGKEQTGNATDRITGETAETGREDPFGGGFGEVVPKAQSDIPIDEESAQPMQPLFVRTVTLKFLKANNLKAALEKMKSDRGAIAVDDNTNSLIICDTKENLEKILAEIKKADQTPKQIMIEVVIIDVQLKNDTEIGVDWDILSGKNYDIGYRQGMIYPYRFTATTNAADVGNATNYMTTGLGGEFSVVSGTVRNVVQLLQEKRNVEILASPRVLVVSGQKAEIKTIRELPYMELAESSGGSLLQSAQFKEVGVTLNVKATLTEDEKIVMEVKPEQSVDTGVTISSVPVVDTRKASTMLVMDDGQVVVMGGLRRQETKHIKYQVPLLGDLPLIGFIFSDDRTIVENSELLVLLSPHIYKGEPVPAEAMARYDQLKNSTLLALPGEPNAQSPDGIQPSGD